MRAGALSKRLQQFALGENDEAGQPVKMTSAQVTAALGILKKCVPDLSAIQHTGEMTHRHVKELSDAELMAIATGGSAGAAIATSGETGPSELH
jgi:hypothetical protein